MIRAGQAELDVEICKSEFDADYYLDSNPELYFDTETPLQHFCTLGWLEGRSPNSKFDLSEYVIENNDVQQAKINPFVHYILYGRDEKCPTKFPQYWKERIPKWNIYNRDRLFWVLTLFLDRQQYLESLGIVENAHSSNVNIALNWINIGAFRDVFPTNNRVTRDKINKAIAWTSSIIEMMSPGDRLIPKLNRAIELIKLQNFNERAYTLGGRVNISDEEKFALSLVQAEFDEQYYISNNLDVDFGEQHPLLHFYFVGWKEGRNPNKEFDCNFYLEINDDVKHAKVNPFFHFLAAGRAEGRNWKKKGGLRRSIVDRVRRPEERRHFAARDISTTLTPVLELQSILAPLIKSKTKFALSFSHDDYKNNIGGTQIFIADEQLKLNKSGFLYIHISPVVDKLYIITDADDYQIRLIVDGDLLCTTSMKRLIGALQNITKLAGRSLGIVHCILGHDPRLVAKLLECVSSRPTFFWTHDYSSICAGFNLLRNDVQFCGAPPLESMACRVCVYGETRAQHSAAMDHFFESVRPVIAAPSGAALNIWRRASTYAPETTVIAPHVDLAWRETESKRYRNFAGTGANPVVVGFVGFALFHKGWDGFLSLVEAVGEDPRYRFVQFSKVRSNASNVDHAELNVTIKDRFAAVRLLKAHGVDIVVNFAHWPETFSYVTYEAAAAGCFVFTHADSGNVADAIKNLEIGRVFANKQDLIEEFASGNAIRYVRMNAISRDRTAVFKLSGTTDAVLNEMRGPKDWY